MNHFLHRSVSFKTFSFVAFLATILWMQEEVSCVEHSAKISSRNVTVLEEIQATGKIVKRVGEFASRTMWIRKGRLVFPTGTIFSLVPQITVPAFRRKAFKGGLNSDFQASMTFYMNCDKLGYTDDMHPFPFDRPPFYPFGPLMRPIEGGETDKMIEEEMEKKKKNPMNMDQLPPPPGATILKGPKFPTGPNFHQQSEPDVDQPSVEYYKNSGSVYANYPIHKRTGSHAQKKREDQPERKAVIGQGARRSNRKPRSIMSLPPPHKLPGGERAILLPRIENIMASFGFEGRGCMLRAICEIHEFPLQEGYGLFGEMIALLFSIRQSPYAESHMPKYLEAEEAGRAGDCSAYKQICAKSIFKWQVERKQDEDEETEINEIPASPFRSKFQDGEL